MKIRCDNSAKFELDILGYEFPQIANEPYDADWLMIQINVTHPRGNWKRSDSCLLTWEVDALSKWFKILAKENPIHSRMEFMEPELNFEWFGEVRNLLRIHLNYNFRPSWSPYVGPKEEKEFFVESSMTAAELALVSDSLTRDVMRFPTRVPVK